MNYGSWILGNTTIYHRRTLLGVGGFNPQLGPFADGLIRQVIVAKQGACFIPEPLGAWRRMETGYSALTGSNPETAKTTCSVTINLMRTIYRDLLPESYVQRWQRRWLFSSVTAFAKKIEKEWIVGLRVLFENHGGLQALVLRVACSIIRVTSWMVQLLAGIFLLRGDICRRVLFKLHPSAIE